MAWHGMALLYIIVEYIFMARGTVGRDITGWTCIIVPHFPIPMFRVISCGVVYSPLTVRIARSSFVQSTLILES